MDLSDEVIVASTSAVVAPVPLAVEHQTQVLTLLHPRQAMLVHVDRHRIRHRLREHDHVALCESEPHLPNAQLEVDVVQRLGELQIARAAVHAWRRSDPEVVGKELQQAPLAHVAERREDALYGVPAVMSNHAEAAERKTTRIRRPVRKARIQRHAAPVRCQTRGATRAVLRATCSRRPLRGRGTQRSSDSRLQTQMPRAAAGRTAHRRCSPCL
jgi:hypothetical protein